VQNVPAAGGRARVKSRGREETVRLQPYFEAKPGDPVERFAAEADWHSVSEILRG